MARSAKFLTPLASLVVLLAIAEYAAAALPGSRLHGHGGARYSLTTEPRFGWVLALLAALWLATYVTGVTETAVPISVRLTRSTGAVLGAVAVISLVEVFLTHFYVPVFDIGSCVIFMPPAMTAVASLADTRIVKQGQQERVLALVSHEEKERLLRDLDKNPERPSQLVLAIDPTDVLPTDGDPAPLERLVEAHKATLLVLSREAQGLDELVNQAVRIHSQGVRIRTLSLFYDEWLGKLPISELERIALLFDINEIHRPVYARVKRFLDVTIALVGAVFLLVSVPFVLVADLFGNRGPLFYKQERVGKNGALFTIVKFRTMRPHNAPTEWTSEDDPRLGKVGRLLRKLHVDELPQVVNVLRKDMSIVGPRPEQPRYVDQLRISIPFYDVRHLVRPGITGWAQVKYDYGASELDALEKLQYEFYYLRHQDLPLDLRTLGRTLRSTFRGEGR